MMLSSCDNSNDNGSDVTEEPQIPEAGLASAMLIFDSSFSQGRESLTHELHMSDANIFPGNIIEIMNLLTGLNFAVSVFFEDGVFFVEWNSNSDIFVDFSEIQTRDEFSFTNAEALRWFMLDSLWRTLTENYPEISDIYFVTNHIHASIVEPSPFSSDTPYRGSPFYTGQTEQAVNDDSVVFSNELYYLDGDIYKGTLTVNLENGDFAVFNAEELEVDIFGFEIIGDNINVLDESGDEAVIVFTVTIIDKYTLQRNDSGEVFKIADGSE
jgi:hypothetical protein